MMKNFVQELKWRGMIQDIMPGTEEKLLEGSTAAYVGIDPTADSLHIGHMVSIMILKHFQNFATSFSTNDVGATKRYGAMSQKSATNVALSWMSETTFSTYSREALMPLLSSIGI